MEEKIEQKYAYISEKIIKALEFAARAHQEQVRKDVHNTPYISHPFGVGLILSNADASEDVIIAGILHDVVEDTSYTYEDIANQFGVQVADLVQWVSIPDGLKGDEGKVAYLKNLKNAPAEARLISAADMLYNRADIILAINNGDDPLSKFNFGSYLKPELNEERIKIIEEALGSEHQLVQDLRTQNQIIQTFNNGR